ncbi:MAG: leucyl aminopeptidase [Ignavibacteriae bacterium]|nr:MAG: leucyl aminopeptidase [Ignavibacteriota bacterium]
MKIKFEVKKIKDIKADAVSSFVFEDQVDQKLHWLNTLFKGGLDVLIESKDFKGTANEVFITYVNGESKTKRLMTAGLGNSKEITLEKLRNAYAAAAKKFNSLKLTSVGFELPDLTAVKGIVNYSIADIVQAICEGVFLSQYSFKRYIEKNEFVPLDEIVFFTDSPKYTKEISDTLKNVKIISDAVFVARDLGNEPSNMLTPNKFAEHVKKLSMKANYTVSIFDEKKIKQLNMGGIIGVSQGSDNPPRFLILQYFGSSKSEKPVVLVGKGVTFDSGGISIKPSVGMENMKMDMCGAAAVVGAFEAISRLHLKLNVIGLIPAVENMPSGTAIKPGDVLKSYSGTTMEVANTDAEGRVILADALDYAANYKPKAVFDIATLTGAAVITFGNLIAGIMGTDDNMKKKLFDAGEKTNERVWELPLYADYEKLMKSEVADIRNIGPAGRGAGTILGGIFLKKFASDKYPWVHIDIAGTAMVPAEPAEYISKDATGFGVRLFVETLKNL